MSQIKYLIPSLLVTSDFHVELAPLRSFTLPRVNLQEILLLFATDARPFA